MRLCVIYDLFNDAVSNADHTMQKMRKGGVVGTIPRTVSAVAVRVTDKLRLRGMRGGSWYKLLGTGGPERGMSMLHVVLSLCNIIICRIYELTVSDQAPVTLQLTVGLSDLV